MYNTRIYKIWTGIITRCTNTSYHLYPDYGGRGITICDEWRYDFMKFYNDMGDMPNGMSLDRIDNDKGYYKENCRWATLEEQHYNKRNTLSVTYKGVTMNFGELSKILGIERSILYKRIISRNWPQERWNEPVRSCY